jgi:hypothetical protein
LQDSQNFYPNWDFWFEKNTIWQPWPQVLENDDNLRLPSFAEIRAKNFHERSF